LLHCLAQAEADRRGFRLNEAAEFARWLSLASQVRRSGGLFVSNGRSRPCPRRQVPLVDAMSVLRPGDTAWPALRLSVPAEERFDDLFGQSGLLEPDPHTWFTAGADAVNGDDATSK
jgi:hypothetical protein